MQYCLDYKESDNSNSHDFVFNRQINADTQHLDQELVKLYFKLKVLEICIFATQIENLSSAPAAPAILSLTLYTLCAELNWIKIRLETLNNYAAIEDINRKKLQGVKFEAAMDQVLRRKIDDVMTGRFAQNGLQTPIHATKESIAVKIARFGLLGIPVSPTFNHNDATPDTRPNTPCLGQSRNM